MMNRLHHVRSEAGSAGADALFAVMGLLAIVAVIAQLVFQFMEMSTYGK